jgi:hypothetical protein
MCQQKRQLCSAEGAAAGGINGRRKPVPMQGNAAKDRWLRAFCAIPSRGSKIYSSCRAHRSTVGEHDPDAAPVETRTWLSAPAFCPSNGPGLPRWRADRGRHSENAGSLRVDLTVKRANREAVASATVSA